MTVQDLIPRVTILAVGVESYENLAPLRGPSNDIDRLKNLLVKNPQTALFLPNQFIELYDPTAEQLREKINEYVLARQAKGDILLLYFSGHGTPLGPDDFGFCVTNTVVHPLEQTTLPLSVVKFSDLLQTISIAHVTPVIIIDACYSGMAGRNLDIPPVEAISIMQHKVHSLVASKYALLCSCSENQESVDTSSGGIFSHYLIEVASKGIRGSKHTPSKSLLGLRDIFNRLEERVLSYSSGNITPRLYLGPTLPDFPLIKNTQYKP